MASDQSASGFDFRADLGSQVSSLHVLENGMSDHSPAHSLADDIRSLIDAGLEHLPAPAPEAGNAVHDLLAAHFDERSICLTDGLVCRSVLPIRMQEGSQSWPPFLRRVTPAKMCGSPCLDRTRSGGPSLKGTR